MITQEDLAGAAQRYNDLDDSAQERVKALVNDPAAPILAYVLNISMDDFKMLTADLMTPKRGLAARQR